jgi:purine-cytosine permease-like protein
VGGVGAGIAAFAAEEREAVVEAEVGLGVGQRSVVVLVPAYVSIREHT